MPTITVPDLLRDPEFRKLPREQQLIGLREVDSDFGTLPEEAQFAALDDPEFQPRSETAQPARSDVKQATVIPGMERIPGGLPRAGAMPARPEYNISFDPASGAAKAGLYLDETMGAVFRPLADMQANVGAAMETKGILPGVGKALREQGDERAAYWAPRSEDALKALADNPEVLGSVDWWLNRGTETMSQMVAFVAAGKGIGGVGGTAAAAAGGGAKATAAAEFASGLLAMSGLEVLIDAGGSAKEVYEQTGNRELAAAVFDRTAKYEAVPTVAGNALGVRNPAAMSVLKRLATSMLAEGAQEAAQGVSQRLAYNVTRDEASPEDQAKLPEKDLLRDAPEEAILGGVFGGGIGGVMEAAGDRAARPRATEVQQGTAPQPVAEQARKKFQPSEKQAEALAEFIATSETGYVSLVKTKNLLGSSMDDARGVLDTMAEMGVLNRTARGQYKRVDVAQPTPTPTAETTAEPTTPAEPAPSEQPVQPDAETIPETIPAEDETEAPTQETVVPSVETEHQEVSESEPPARVRDRGAQRSAIERLRERRRKRVAQAAEPEPEVVQPETETIQPDTETTGLAEETPAESSPEKPQRVSGAEWLDKAKERAATKKTPDIRFSDETLRLRSKAQRAEALRNEIRKFRSRTEEHAEERGNDAGPDYDWNEEKAIQAERLANEFKGIRRLALNRMVGQAIEAELAKEKPDPSLNLYTMAEHRAEVAGEENTERLVNRLLEFPEGTRILEQWLDKQAGTAMNDLASAESRDGGSLLLPGGKPTLRDRLAAQRAKRSTSNKRGADPVRSSESKGEAAPQESDPVSAPTQRESETKETVGTIDFVLKKGQNSPTPNRVSIAAADGGYKYTVNAGSAEWGSSGIPSRVTYETEQDAARAGLKAIVIEHLKGTMFRPKAEKDMPISVEVVGQALEELRRLGGPNSAPSEVVDDFGTHVRWEYRRLLDWARDHGALQRWKDSSDEHLDRFVEKSWAQWQQSPARAMEDSALFRAVAESLGATPKTIRKMLKGEPSTPKGKASSVKAGQTNGTKTDKSPDDSTRTQDSAPLEGAPSTDEPAPSGEGIATQDGDGGSGSVRGSDDGSVPQGDGLPPSEGDRPDGEGMAADGDGPADFEPVKRPRTPAVDLSRDFRILPEHRIGEGGESTKADDNIAALEVLKTLREEQREATPEEKAKLARYVGWGGLSEKIFSYNYDDSYEVRTSWEKRRRRVFELLSTEDLAAARTSTLNAHYTSPAVIQAMWQAVARLGVSDGPRVLEPAAGVGNFFGLMPESLMAGAKRMAVELDTTTAEIFKHLYPASPMQNMGYQDASLPGNYFDLVISNVPFGKYPVTDKTFKRNSPATRAIHDYFMAKALRHVRPGGLVAVITSRYTMDKGDSTIRELLSEQADLVAAWRLPNTAFKQNALTQVDTDVLFLRRRVDGEEPAGKPWLQLKEITAASGDKVYVNEYFVDNPAMVLGEITTGRGRHHEGELMVTGKLSPEILQSAVEALPEGVIRPAPKSQAAPQDQFIPAVEFGATRDMREGSLVEKDGKFYVREANGFVEERIPETQRERVRGLIGVRAAVRDVFRHQLTSDDDAALATLQQALGRTYDAFVKKFGVISHKNNQKWFADDPDNPLLLALETDFDRKTGTSKKTAIFERRTIARPREADRADSPSEALLITLAERGRVDMDRVAQLVGEDPDAVSAKLSADGLIYRDPATNQWVSAEEYLSGDVREKLRLARKVAAVDPDYQQHVEALEKVQPTDLEPKDISLKIGAPWIPAEVYAAFMNSVLKKSGRVNAEVTRAPVSGEWRVSVSKQSRVSPENTTEWGTLDRPADDLIERIMNARPLDVIRKTEDGRSYKDEAASIAVEEKAAKLEEAFNRLVWQSSYADRLAALYNEKFNNMALRKYDGSHLTFPGMAKSFLRKGDLDPHQKNAVWRILNSQNTLLAHVVGAGKTFEMIGAGVELKRIGRARKPMYVVPNHMLEQWAGDWVRLYPTAKVHVVGKDSLSGTKRHRALARIATGDYDAVIVAHSTFGKIGVSPERMSKHIQEEIDELREAILATQDDDRTVKKLEARMKTAEERLKAALQSVDRDEVGATFEELGVDWLFVDESHEFKNLTYATRMSNVKGLGDPQGAQKTADLLMKIGIVNDLQGGGGVTFASGTPVSNSMAEIFLVMRYLMPTWLREKGLRMFDDWAQTFASISSAQEVNVASTYQPTQRLAKFRNFPELMTAFSQVADIMSAKMLNLPRPRLKGGKAQIIAVPMTPLQAAYQKLLIERAKEIKKRGGPPEKGQDILLKVASDGRNASLDMRLIDPTLPDLPGTKLDAAAGKIAEIHKRTEADRLTQAVFIDYSSPDSKGEFNAYQSLKEKLIAKGIPAEEIAFIHDANSDEKKADLFADVNAGRVRVILGSTPKMGAGTNIQRLLVALHHIDVAWRPSDVEQREGRILRPGNQNEEVEIFRYVTEGSFDGFLWQTLEAKAGFVSRVLSGEITGLREIEDEDSIVLDFQQMKAIASGNPLIREQFVWEEKLRRLEIKQGNERREARKAKSDLDYERNLLPRQQRDLEHLTADIAARGNTEKFEARILGVDYDSTSGNVLKAGESLVSHIQERSKRNQNATLEVGNLWNVPVRIELQRSQLVDSAYISGVHIGTSLNVRLATDRPERLSPQGTMASIMAAVRGIEKRADEVRKSIEERQTRIDSLKEVAEGASANTEEYLQARAKLAEIMAKLAEQTAQDGRANANDGEDQISARRVYEETVYQARMGRLSRADQAGFGSLDFLTFGLAGLIQDAIRKPEPVAPKERITKSTMRSLLSRRNKLDWTPERLQAYLKKHTRRDAMADLSRDEAVGLLAQLGDERPAGLGMSAALGLTRVIHSPSFILGRSLRGRRIYQEAEDQYFRQEQIADRYTRNYTQAVTGLSKQQKHNVMLYRFVRQLIQMHQGKADVAAMFLDMLGEDPTLAENPAEILLSDAERRANRLLTAKVYEPMRQEAVRRGWLEPDQKYEDYLAFYRDEHFQRNPGTMADAAVRLAHEMGIPVSMAQALLDRANVKNVKFGSVDYVRNQWTIPGMRDLDKVTEIYVKGFARKVAISDFLTVANPMMEKIPDRDLRQYAKSYIDQYAGRPEPGVTMMDRAIQAIPWLRNRHLSGSEIAGWLTAIQYQAKIGFNLWTPLLNLTQTAINTTAKYGFRRTARAAVKGTAVLTAGRIAAKMGLPPSENPFIRDLVELRRSGVLDSLGGKFERPVLHGWAEAAGQFGTAMFAAAEAFNRATAYFAGADMARAQGLGRVDVERAGRQATRITQFYSGRLDAPLFARTPFGKVVMQFKSFPLKQLEFMRGLRGKEAVRFALANVMLGGFGAFYLRQALNAIGDDWEVTKWVNQFDESFSVAALLHAWKLADQVGLKQVPGTDKLGEGGWTDWTLRWIAGPSLMALFETVQDTARMSTGGLDAARWTKTLIRAWAPGGVQINRTLKAVEKTQDPWERLEIMLNLGESDLRNRGEAVPADLGELRKEIERERRKLRRELRQ